MTRRARSALFAVATIVAAAAPCAWGRTEQPASAPPTPPSGAPGAPGKPGDAGKPAPMPGLDELLGLPPADKRPAPAPGIPTPGTPAPGTQTPGAPGAEPLPGASRDAISTELQRKLADKAIDDNFKQAVQLMADVASRLAGARDAGIDTQRTQEEIVRRLDALIQAAKEREQQQSSSQSQSQSQKQSEQQQKPTPQGRPQQQQQQQAGANDNRGEVTPPGLKTGALNKEALDAAVAAWGSLPERVREALLQGAGDRFSSLYDALTQEYYRRLAEEKPRE